MDKFDSIANTVLRKIDKVTIKEGNEIVSVIDTVPSFGDFMRSLVGKSIKNILGQASFSRLLHLNVKDSRQFSPEYKFRKKLESQLFNILSDFVNQDITKLRSGAAETDEFKNKYDYQGYLEREKERRDLYRQQMTEKDPEKKSELRQKMNAFRNNTEYAEARRALYAKEDKAVDKFHNAPIEAGQFVNDGSDEYNQMENLFKQIQAVEVPEYNNPEVEDQEGEIQVDLDTAEKGLKRLAKKADDPARGPFDRLFKRSGNKAKKALERRDKVHLKGIPAYNKVTKKMEDAYNTLSQQGDAAAKFQ